MRDFCLEAAAKVFFLASLSRSLAIQQMAFILLLLSDTLALVLGQVFWDTSHMYCGFWKAADLLFPFIPLRVMISMASVCLLR